MQQTQDELRAKNIQLVEAANENAENLALRVKAEEAAAKAEAINAKQQELAAAQRDEIAHLKAMLEQQVCCVSNPPWRCTPVWLPTPCLTIRLLHRRTSSELSWRGRSSCGNGGRREWKRRA